MFWKKKTEIRYLDFLDEEAKIQADFEDREIFEESTPYLDRLDSEEDPQGIAREVSRGIQSGMIHVTYRDKHIHDNDHDLWYLTVPGPDSVEHMKMMEELVGWDMLLKKATIELRKSGPLAENPNNLLSA